MTSMSPGHRGRQRKESDTPPPSAHSLQYDHNNWAIYFRSTHWLDTILATPETELGQVYVVVFNLSLFADLYFNFPVEVQTQVWKAAVNMVSFFPTSLHRFSSVSYRPSGSWAGDHWPSLGEKRAIAFSQLQWPPLAWEWPFPVLWHF